jgi:hypothetical protein
MSREEDDAVALVRVYCGLASADLNATPPGSVTWLTVALVDDAGRLLDICDISDDASGFAELGSLLAERSNGLESVGIAADSDDHIVTQLLTAAGRYLAYTDEDSAEDYAERFGDDESADEIQSSPAERRAIGLARALQAGVLSAVAQATPRDLLGLKPVLAAHAAVTTGRQGAAATLREVLRELYPAALRAFPDPAEAIPLAILDALPEPGPLGSGANGRGRDAQAIAELTEAGVAESAVITEAVTALRVAIAETPRRTGMNRSITSAVAETVRQSVAAVRACDAAAAALVSVLAARMPSASAPARTAATRSTASRAAGAAEPAAAVRTAGTDEPARPASRRSRSQSSAVRPRSAPPVLRPQSAPPAPAPAEPVAPAAPAAPAASAASAAAAFAAGAHRANAGGQPAATPPPATRQPGSRRSAAAQQQPAVVEQAPAAQAPVPVQTPGAAPVPVQAPTPAPVPVQAPPAPIPVPPPATVPAPVHPAAHSQPVPRPQQVAPVPPPGLTPTYTGAAQPAYPGPAQPAYADPAQPAAAHATPPADDPRITPASRQFTPAAAAAPEPARRPAPPAAPMATPSVPAPAGPPPISSPPSPSYYSNGDRYTGSRAAEFTGQRAAAAEFTGSRPAADVPPPGSRASWPLVGDAMRDPAEAHRTAEPRTYGTPAETRTGTLRIDPTGVPDAVDDDLHRQREGRVMPPWQADDLPAEPPALRLVEPAPLADPALSSERVPQYRDEFDGKLRFEPPALRLVEPKGGANGSPNGSAGAANGSERLPRRPATSKPAVTESADPPVKDESDGDLLIFAEARSAWFTDHFGEDDVKLEWSTASDAGWRAAEQAAEPAVGIETGSGLPRRVPQQNLVPGSPIAAPERPLRIVRDAAAIAAHTTGYFRGWRRGQEVGGYRVGGRPGRESAGWDFSRDQDGDRDYEYRSARR